MGRVGAVKLDDNNEGAMADPFVYDANERRRVRQDLLICAKCPLARLAGAATELADETAPLSQRRRLAALCLPASSPRTGRAGSR